METVAAERKEKKGIFLKDKELVLPVFLLMLKRFIFLFF